MESGCEDGKIAPGAEKQGGRAEGRAQWIPCLSTIASVPQSKEKSSRFGAFFPARRTGWPDRVPTGSGSFRPGRNLRSIGVNAPAFAAGWEGKEFFPFFWGAKKSGRTNVGAQNAKRFICGVLPLQRTAPSGSPQFQTKLSDHA